MWSIEVPLLGADLTVQTSPGGSIQTIGLGSVITASLLSSLLGWALLALLERWSERARTVWTATAGGLLLLSLAGPLVAAVTTTGTVSLTVLHLSVAALFIPLMRHTATPR